MEICLHVISGNFLCGPLFPTNINIVYKMVAFTIPFYIRLFPHRWNALSLHGKNFRHCHHHIDNKSKLFWKWVPKKKCFGHRPTYTFTELFFFFFWHVILLPVYQNEWIKNVHRFKPDYFFFLLFFPLSRSHVNWLPLCVGGDKIVNSVWTNFFFLFWTYGYQRKFHKLQTHIGRCRLNRKHHVSWRGYTFGWWQKWKCANHHLK